MTGLHHLLVPIVSLTALPVFLWLLKPLAEKIDLIDHPDNGRKRHNGSVPLIGGIAILLTLTLALTLSDVSANDLGMPSFFWPAISVLLALVVIAHAIDDILEINATTRLVIDGTLALLIATVALVQIVTLGNLFGMGEVTLGRYAIPMTIFSFIAASNAFNMTDGIDSQCTGFGLVAFTSLIIFLVISGDPQAAPLINVLGIITLALIPMYLANMGKLGPDLRSFLGDSGARLIGFMAATTVIMAASRGFIDPVYAFFPIAIPVCDCLILMAVRVANKRSPISADRRHLHHLLMDNGLTSCQARRTAIWLGITFAIIGMGLHAAGAPEVVVSILVVSLFAAFIALRIWLTERAGARAPRTEALMSRRSILPGQQDPTVQRARPLAASHTEDEKIRASSGNS